MSEANPSPDEQTDTIDASTVFCEFMDILTKIAENNAITEQKVNSLAELIPVIKRLVELTTSQGIEIEKLKIEISNIKAGKVE